MANLTTRDAVKRQLSIGKRVNGTLQLDQVQFDDDLIDDYVTQASAVIESEANRSFSGDVGTLYYDTCSSRVLHFDADVVAVVSITNGDDGTMSASDYRLLPVNASPKYAIELLGGKSWKMFNGARENAITVIGTLGYCAANAQPADITLLATKLAAHFYLNRDNDGSVIKMADGTANIPSEIPSFVLKTLRANGYVRDVIKAG